MSFLWFCLIGLCAGWLAGQFVKGGFGLVGDLIIGVIGAILGGWIFGLLGIHTDGGLLGALVCATVGAVVLLLIVRALKKKA